jgi:hypothetical protein
VAEVNAELGGLRLFASPVDLIVIFGLVESMELMGEVAKPRRILGRNTCPTSNIGRTVISRVTLSSFDFRPLRLMQICQFFEASTDS